MSEYWKKRFEQVEARQNKSSQNVCDNLKEKYIQATREIDEKIRAWVERFAKNNGISMSEARQMLNSKELEELKWDINQYIKHGEENAIDGRWKKELENASARFHISRLESLKLHVRQCVEKATGGMSDSVESMLKDVYTDTYYRSAYEIQKGIGIGFDVGRVDERKLSKVINTPWSVDDENFSTKLWKNKTKLINVVDNELTKMVMMGTSPDKVSKAIEKQMNTSYSNAQRVVLTEQAYITSLAQKDTYADLSVDEIEIVATLDMDTCGNCGQYDGKHFRARDMRAGINCPPFHPYCRCTTCPYFDDMDGYRASRDKEGKTVYEIPANMTYVQWKNKFVKNSPAELKKKEQQRQKILESIKIKKIWNGCPEDKKEAIFKAIENGDVRFLQLAERTMDNVVVNWRMDEDDTSHYNRMSGEINLFNHVYFDDEKANNEAFAQAFWHEYGHFVDDGDHSKSGLKYTVTFMNRSGISNYEYNDVSSIADEIGYKKSASKDINNLLKKLGLSDKYYAKESGGWLHRKSDDSPFDFEDTKSTEDMFKLEKALRKKFEDMSGETKADNYLYDMGYPRSPNIDDYQEWYTTPKRKTLKCKWKFKGAEEAYQKAVEECENVREEFAKTHDIHAIIEEQERLQKKAEQLKNKLGAVSDTVDGASYGAFLSNIFIGGHSSEYYRTNKHHIKEGVANVFMANITRDKDIINAYNEICPEIFNTITEAFTYEQ